ncbi:MAG: HypC/HybG/HupF family hydrogenase formation chaperone, partial [Planctomycetota bacterium]|nr:HypC/HybG/HupF family hydrogenase formation chaperone [Planctomycetota bacterium]
MCYAIPGKVVEIDERIATIEYFGERKKAYTDLTETFMGDYVYAQGGFVIQKVPEAEAQEILSDWKELFFRLQETDQKLTNNPKNLYQRANALRQKHQGNSCCIHGILEFSNYCKNNCLYCGIRNSNKKLQRYRMTSEEILSAVDYAVNQLGFKALVLQSGEDYWYDENTLYQIVKDIRQRYPVLIFISIGERELSTYQKLHTAGARGVLLRFETSDSALYAQVKPDSKLQRRLELIRKIRSLGYLVITGFLVGLPGSNGREKPQIPQIIRNIKL